MNFERTKKTIAIVLGLLVTASATQYRRSCNLTGIALTNTKVFCETSQGLSVSCLEPGFAKAYVQCESAYYNGEKQIDQQILYCLDNGAWSAEPLKCLPKCSDSIKSIDLKAPNDLQFPTSYVEIISPTGSNSSRIPAVILNERDILTRMQLIADYLEEAEASGWKIMIPKSGAEAVEIRITKLTANKVSSDRQFVVLRSAQSLKFDHQTQPICDMNQIEGENEKNTILYDKVITTPSLDNLDKCIMPRIESSEVDVKCFAEEASNSSQQLLPAECLVFNEALATRCQKGYRNANSVAPILSTCYRGSWRIYGNYDDCELECGRVAAENKNDLLPNYYAMEYVGAENAPTPWHVAIHVKRRASEISTQRICGGSIIYSNVILSAGHCFFDESIGRIRNTSNYMVGIGERSAEGLFAIKRILLPVSYRAHPLRNDIALVILQNDLKFSSLIKPACIDWSQAARNQLRQTTKGLIVSWNQQKATMIPGDSANASRVVVSVKSMAKEECLKLVDPFYWGEITKDRFCAGNEQNVTACGGDSGGGFVHLKQLARDSRFTLAGVISVGLNVANNCDNGLVTVFTSVQHHRNFIKSMVARHADVGLSAAVLAKYTDIGAEAVEL